VTRCDCRIDVTGFDTDPRRQSDRTGFGECGEARDDLRGSGAGALHRTRPQTGEIGLAGIELTPLSGSASPSKAFTKPSGSRQVS
jgi:hypothetical protein